METIFVWKIHQGERSVRRDLKTLIRSTWIRTPCRNIKKIRTDVTISKVFLNKFFGHKYFLWSHWYRCFGLLVTSLVPQWAALFTLDGAVCVVLGHPAGTSKQSNKCDNIQSFWLEFYNGRLWGFFIFRIPKITLRSTDIETFQLLKL